MAVCTHAQSSPSSPTVTAGGQQDPLYPLLHAPVPPLLIGPGSVCVQLYKAGLRSTHQYVATQPEVRAGRPDMPPYSRADPAGCGSHTQQASLVMVTPGARPFGGSLRSDPNCPAREDQKSQGAISPSTFHPCTCAPIPPPPTTQPAGWMPSASPSTSPSSISITLSPQQAK